MKALIQTCISVVSRLISASAAIVTRPASTPANNLRNARCGLMAVASVAIVYLLSAPSLVHAKDPGGVAHPPAPWTYLHHPSSSSAWCESSPLPEGEPDQCWCTGGTNSPDCMKIQGMCTRPIICDYRNMCVCRADGAGDIPPF